MASIVATVEFEIPDRVARYMSKKDIARVIEELLENEQQDLVEYGTAAVTAVTVERKKG